MKGVPTAFATSKRAETHQSDRENPQADMSSGDFDFIAFTEEYGISLKSDEKEPKEFGITGLVNPFFSLATSSGEGENH